MLRTWARTAAVIACATTLASCGSGTDTPESSAAPSAATTAAGSPAATPAASAPTDADDLAARAPGRILDESFAAASAAQSMKVTASVTTPEGNTAYALTATDQGLQGQLLLPSIGPAEMVIVDDSLYLRGTSALNATFLPEEEAKAAAGKWLKLPATEAINIGLLPATNKQGLLVGAIAPQEDRKLKVTDKTRQVGGIRCLGLDSGNGVLWVAAAGEPYPMALTSADKSAGTFEMSDWDQPVELTAPAEGEVIDLSAAAQPGP